MSDLSKVMSVPSGSEENFVFGLNDFVFSDRVLRLEITPDDDSYSEDDSTASRKKLKGEKYNDWFSCIDSKDSKSSDGARVTTLHICSLILAAKSPFFYKLFKNGMRESQNKDDVCFKINASEEATLMDLIRFMYGNCALNATSFTDLVDLLIAADKFEVTSCMSHCVGLLLKFPMSLEYALFCLELPSSVLVSEIVKPLIDAAKQFVVALYKNFTKSQEKALQLPLSGLEVVLGSEGLQVESEDVIFDFVLKWARASYPELEERRGILTIRLAPLICFPNMSVQKLKEVLVCADFDQEHVSKLVHKALFSKVERSCGKHIRDSEVLSTNESGSVGRVYNPHCVVFFDLTKYEFECLSPSEQLDSEFRLGGKLIYLLVCCEDDHFGLCLNKESVYETCAIDFEIAVMKKSSREFESKLKVNNHNVMVNGRRMSRSNLLGVFTRTELMSDDCDYFIDGVLRLRVELTLKNS